MPLLLLLAIFVLIPATELYVLIEVGSEIGALSTIWLVILTALVGGWMVRQQGLAVMFRVREQLERGEPPAIEMMEGVLLLLIGILLLLPGFITDTLGFLLLIPPLRRWLILNWLKRRGNITPVNVDSHNSRPEHYIIEGE
ncbi:MAG: FxsA family protein, partial [Pseudomonadota bacterium]|nr:FxsA family protein [Pseudomonadota bacterium]